MVLVEYKWMLRNIYGENKGPTKGGASGNNHKNLESEKKERRRVAYTATTNTERRIDQSKSACSFLSAIVVTQIPSGKLLKTSLKVGGGLVTELSLRGTDVSMSEGHIPIPRHLHNVPLCLDFQQSLENTHQIGHWDRGGVSKIENP